MGIGAVAESMMLRRGLIILLATAGCSGTTFDRTALQSGSSAYAMINADAGMPAAAYRIGTLDKLDVVIFQEPELSVRGVEVDPTGKIPMPLIGDVVAEGKTGTELAAAIGSRYGERILENPQVSVSVKESISRKVIVQGEVAQPGVFDMKGSTTLLEAIALAKGETRVAAMRDVAVFRTIDGKRHGALFDVAAIRRGEQADPVLQGRDTVIVGISRTKNAWRDVLATAPFLAVFRPLGY